MTTPIPVATRPDGSLQWGELPIHTDMAVQIDNIVLRFMPEGYIAICFDREGGTFDVPTLEKVVTFLQAVLPEPGYATWELMATRPSLGLRQVSKTLSAEEFGLCHCATVVGPVGKMIMGFFTRVVRTPIQTSVHTSEASARAHVLRLMEDVGYQAPWLAK